MSSESRKFRVSCGEYRDGTFRDLLINASDVRDGSRQEVDCSARTKECLKE